MKKLLYKIKQNKKKSILILSLIVLTLVTTFGLTYAYFGLNVDQSQLTDVNIVVGNLEQFTFASGDALTVASSDIGQTGTTHPSATLISGADGHTIDSTYDMYFDINTNTFEYTEDGSPLPEVLLTVIDPNGVEITESDSLTHVNVEGHTGFDITGLTGFFPVTLNYPISTSSSTVGTTQEWDISITYVDLSIDQSHNNNKTLTGTFILKNGMIKTLPELILEDNGGKEVIEAKPNPDFSQTAVSNEGVFSTVDDYGTSYYYRGAVDNNWVEFAGFYWRIIRINGDGSVRMIYSGITAPTESQSVVMKSSGTQIETNPFNIIKNLAEYTGYMYQVGQQHGNVSSSDAKVTVDNWYIDNIYNNGYHSYLSDTLFCVDRTSYTGTAGTHAASGTGTSTQYFGSYIRNKTQSNPTLECLIKEDSFTVSDTINGNGALGFPVGLISADEVSHAGGSANNTNNYYYLYTGFTFWTISAVSRNSISGIVFYINASGTLADNYVDTDYGIRPVLSIKPSALASGSGQWNDPYVVL